MTGRWLAGAALAMSALTGCLSHEVEMKPIKVEPIYIKIDIDVKLQKEFEQLFDFEEKGKKGSTDKGAETKDR